MAAPYTRGTPPTIPGSDKLYLDEELKRLEQSSRGVTEVIALLAPLASPTFTGDPKAPTPSAGDNDTSIATTAFVQTALGSYRRKLSVATTYYIRTDGNDSNDGSANDAAHAWRTLNGAFRYIARNVDLGGQNVTIEMANGIYPPAVMNFAWTGTSFVQVRGQGVNTIIQATANNDTLILVGDQCALAIGNCRFSSGGFSGVIGVSTDECATIDLGPTNLDRVWFDAMHIGIKPTFLSEINIVSPVTIQGNMTAFFQAQQNSRIAMYSADVSADITLSGSPVFSFGFGILTDGTHLSTGGFPVNFSGSAGAASGPGLYIHRATEDDSATVWPSGTGQPSKQNWAFPPASYTTAGLPASNQIPGALAYVTDAPGSPQIQFWDGTNSMWRQCAQYFEGAWTPSDISGGALSLTTMASYVRLGRMVFATFSITYPVTGDVNRAQVSLPVACRNDGLNSWGGAISFPSYSAGAGPTSVAVLSNTSIMRFVDAAGVQLDNNQMSGKTIRGTAIYASA